MALLVAGTAPVLAKESTGIELAGGAGRAAAAAAAKPEALARHA